MRSTLSDDQKIMSCRRLLLAKQLYQHGLSHMQDNGSLNKMIAIHSFHNAIEITLRAILLDYEIRSAKTLNIDFESMLGEIDNHFKKINSPTPIKLPYRQEVRNLNQVRNMVQHHGHEPESTMMDEWRVFTYRFLEKTFNEYFDQDFNAISPIELIDDPRLKQLLKLALDKLLSKDWRGATNFSKFAFTLAVQMPRFFALNSLGIYDIQNSLRIINTLGARDLGRKVGDIIRDVDKRISDIEHLAIMLSSGVKVLDLKRYYDIPLAVHISDDGTAEFVGLGVITAQDAKWIHNFVIDSIIKWQLDGFSPGVSEQLFSGIDQVLKQFGSPDVEKTEP
ncbi:MAG: hypothetical protein ABIJ25_11120 [Pseudomonadota bacterium]